MSRTTLKDDLLNKMIVVRIDVAGYLFLRRAKGYMSVTESEHLREDLFDLSNEFRQTLPALKATLCADDIALFEQGIAAAGTAAVCLMSGHRDCPHYITIDADRLENCLQRLSYSLNKLLAVQLAIEA